MSEFPRRWRIVLPKGGERIGIITREEPYRDTVVYAGRFEDDASDARPRAVRYHPEATLLDLMNLAGSFETVQEGQPTRGEFVAALRAWHAARCDINNDEAQDATTRALDALVDRVPT